jgi:hypothetical protein
MDMQGPALLSDQLLPRIGALGEGLEGHTKEYDGQGIRFH